MSLLRNLGRRKLRTTLTVLGIVIGIWANRHRKATMIAQSAVLACASGAFVGVWNPRTDPTVATIPR